MTLKTYGFIAICFDIRLFIVYTCLYTANKENSTRRETELRPVKR